MVFICFSVCMRECHGTRMEMRMHECHGTRVETEDNFKEDSGPHSTLWVLEVRLRLSDLTVGALSCCITLSTPFLSSSRSLFSGQQSLRESFDIRSAKSLLSSLSLAFSSCSQHSSDNVRLKAHIQVHLMKRSEKGE